MVARFFNSCIGLFILEACASLASFRIFSISVILLAPLLPVFPLM